MDASVAWNAPCAGRESGCTAWQTRGNRGMESIPRVVRLSADSPVAYPDNDRTLVAVEFEITDAQQERLSEVAADLGMHETVVLNHVLVDGLFAALLWRTAHAMALALPVLSGFLGDAG